METTIRLTKGEEWLLKNATATGLIGVDFGVNNLPGTRKGPFGHRALVAMRKLIAHNFAVVVDRSTSREASRGYTAITHTIMAKLTPEGLALAAALKEGAS